MKVNFGFVIAVALATSLPSIPAIAQQHVAVKSTALDKPEVTLSVKLYLPEGSGPFPVVVHVNSSGGAKDVTLTRSPMVFLRRGIALAAVDTFTPRGIDDTAVDQSKISSWHMAVDALNVAAALRNDRRFRTHHVAVLGQSKGAIAVYNLAFRFSSRLLTQGKQPFNAYLLMAPSCAVQFPDKAVNGPTNVLLAEKDEMTPAPICVALFEAMKRDGQPVSLTVIPAANHNWSTKGWVYLPDIYTVRKCADRPLIMTEFGRFHDDSGRTFRDNEILERCGERGAHVGGNSDRLETALESHARFLKSLGW